MEWTAFELTTTVLLCVLTLCFFIAVVAFSCRRWRRRGDTTKATLITHVDNVTPSKKRSKGSTLTRSPDTQLDFPHFSDIQNSKHQRGYVVREGGERVLEAERRVSPAWQPSDAVLKRATKVAGRTRQAMVQQAQAPTQVHPRPAEAWRAPRSNDSTPVGKDKQLGFVTPSHPHSHLLYQDGPEHGDTSEFDSIDELELRERRVRRTVGITVDSLVEPDPAIALGGSHMMYPDSEASEAEPQPASFRTTQPTNQPTSQPANQPTSQPASQPTSQPANQPSQPSQPTSSRSFKPSSLDEYLSPRNQPATPSNLVSTHASLHSDLPGKLASQYFAGWMRHSPGVGDAVTAEAGPT